MTRMLRLPLTLLLAAYPAYASGASAAHLPVDPAFRVSAASTSPAIVSGSASTETASLSAEQAAQGSPPEPGQDDLAESVDESHQSAVLWKQGNWTVLGDKEDCSLDLSFAVDGEEGSFSSMGVTLHFGDTSARVAFANAKFTQIQADKEYPLAIVFLRGETADARWGTRSFTGFEDFQANALFADLPWDEFHRDLIEATTLAIFLNGELLDRYPLSGAGVAVSRLEQCLVSNGAPGVSDPPTAAFTT